MRAGPTKQDVITSFNRIAAYPDRPDLNGRYADLILKQVPPGCRNALDIGCGTGELTLRLSPLSQNVVGIDIADRMIDEARQRHAAPNISYLTADFDTWESGVRFDLIVSVAAFHHLDLATALPKCREMLSERGVLVVLDLRDSAHSLLDLLSNVVAVPVHQFFLRRDWGNASPEETDGWKSHFKMDRFLTLGALRRIYKEHFDSVEMKRLLFWRYLAVCR